VAAWADCPDPDPAQARQIDKKMVYAFDRIEDAGPRAGDKFFKKIRGVPDLHEVRLEVGNRAIRIFGGIASGGRICLTKVLDGKKKDSLRTEEYRRHARIVKEHVDNVESE
jgi:Gp49-like protein DUF891